MTESRLRSFVILRAIYLVAWMAFASSVCSAQQQKASLPFAEHKFLDRPVTISVRQKGLVEILENLAITANIDVVTDGVPDRLAANVSVQGTVREALDQITAGFDCGWSVTKSGVVLIARRFTDPAEHPQIHLKEMQRMMRDIHSTLGLVPPEALQLGFVSLLNQIAHSFTPEQAAASANGNLSGAGLNPQQFAWLNVAILNETLAPTVAKCDEILPLMEGMPKSFLQLKPLANPDKGLDPTDQFSNAARFPSFDYLYVVRGKNGRLVPYYMGKWQVN